MSADDNIETVKFMYDAFGRGDAAAILERVTDDVDWATEADSDAAPWYGQRRVFTPLAYTANDSDHYWRFRDGKVEYYRGTEDTALTAATLQG